MPPRQYSRHAFTEAAQNSDGVLRLSDRVPYKFRALADTIQHRTGSGESLFVIAARYYKGLPRPAGLWWVIADFQPNPIFDPTLVLVEGSVLFVPSLRTVQELVFDPRRRAKDDAPG